MLSTTVKAETVNTMLLAELKQKLAAAPEKNVQFVLPTGTKIPLHSHVTDVARIEKRFIDCGGKFRTEIACRLQTWFSDVTEHRIHAKTLSKILEKASPFLETEDLEVEIEHEAPFISQFPVSSIEADGETLVIRLGIKHTACLAQDSCGVPAPKKDTNFIYKPLVTLQPTKCCS